MKTCPQCGATYDAAQRFCSHDGSVLIQAAGRSGRQGRPRTAGVPQSVPSECPVCGSRLLDSHGNCAVCGGEVGRLAAKAAQPSPPGATRPNANPAKLADSDQPATTMSGGGRHRFAVGLALIVVIGLVAGAWFVVHFGIPGSLSPAPPEVPNTTQAVVGLARNQPVAVSGAAADTARIQEMATRCFSENSLALLGLYRRALADDPWLHGTVLAELDVAPDGSAADASIRSAEMSDPSFNGSVTAAMKSWRLGAGHDGGEVQILYPIIFARDSFELAQLDRATER